MQACTPSPSPYWYRGLDLRKHQVVRKLGTGGFCWVDLAAVQLPDGSVRHMAVKNLAVQGGPEHMHRVAVREVEAMKLMEGCPYGLELYGSTFGYLTEDERDQPQLHYQLFMELAEKGTLKDELVSEEYGSIEMEKQASTTGGGPGDEGRPVGYVPYIRGMPLACQVLDSRASANTAGQQVQGRVQAAQ